MNNRDSKTLEKLIDEISDLIVSSSRLVVFTGAGISTESGLPDFRGPDGIWTKMNPDDFTYQKYVSDPETRKRMWQTRRTGAFHWSDVQPNAAHFAIAELERLGKLDCVITQNVDGLHQKAGNSEGRVIELHGNMKMVKCLSCGRRYHSEEVEQWLERGIEVPECECGGILKSDAVFFGEPMPAKETAEAEKRSRHCDVCIVIGSTLLVYPAALMPQYAVNSGARLVIINNGQTGLDQAAHIRVWGRAGDVMSQILEKVKSKLGIID